MRPLPVVAGGASGGLVGLCFQVLRDLDFGTNLVPPEPELSTPVSSYSWIAPSNFLENLHWPSLALGLLLGLSLGPLLDLAFLLRLLALRYLRRSARLLPTELYRILE